jgi:hypothetical protein
MSEITATKKKFDSALKRGTGEAYLIMRDNPTIDFSASIIRASIKNYAYDGQCENSRADYLFEFISLSKQKNKIKDAILKALREESNDTWTLTQLFDLAKMLAREGYEEARQAMRDRFHNNIIGGSDWIGCSEILALDEMDGLKFIADKMGRSLEAEPESCPEYWFIKRFQEVFPEINVMQELEMAGEDNQFIKTYLDYVMLSEEKDSNYKRTEITYKDIIEEAILGKKSWFRRRKLDEEEVLLIANNLVIEKKRKRLEKFLEVFTRYEFPLDSQYILNLAKYNLKKKKRIVELAVEALKFLQGERIREFAIEQINTSKQPQRFTIILKANYRQGDDRLLEELAEKAENEDLIEWLAVNYIEIFKTNKTTECKGPLEQLYRKMTCAIHRKDVVELLIENGVLSEHIKAEIRFDCEEDTSALYSTVQRP